MLRTIIVDDEPRSLKTTTSVLQHYCNEELDILGTAADAKSGAKLIRELKPDLVFLDVEMPGGSGFHMLEELYDENFEVVFLTAHEKYARLAFKYAPMDYLLKPLDSDDLLDTVERIKTKRRNNKQNSWSTRLVIPTTEAYEVILVDDIISCAAQANYTNISLQGDISLLVSKTLGDIEAKLNPDEFVRIHRSQIVQLKYIKRFLRQDGGYVEMVDGSKLPVAQRRKNELLQRLMAKK